MSVRRDDYEKRDREERKREIEMRRGRQETEPTCLPSLPPSLPAPLPSEFFITVSVSHKVSINNNVWPIVIIFCKKVFIQRAEQVIGFRMCCTVSVNVSVCFMR